MSTILLAAIMGASAASPVAQPLLDPTDTTNNYGSASTTVGSAIAMGGHVYFFTGDNSGTTHTLKLWQTDGTQASTTLVKDLGIEASYTSLLTNGTKLYWTTSASGGVGALWQSDGTSAGTSQVSGVGGASGTVGGRPGSQVLVGSTLYFAADSDGAGSFQLYKYTGSGSATQLTTRNNFGDTGRQVLGSINGVLFWGGLSATGIVDVFRYDPANPVTNGTKVTSFSSGSNLTAFVPDANGTSLFFEADAGTDGTNNHWFRIESDGTGLKDLTPNGTNVVGAPFVKVGGSYYMVLSDSGHGSQIWKSDGTTVNGATLFSDHGTRTTSLTSNFAVLGTKLIFSGAFAGTTGTEPGVIDTTDANGTSSILGDLFPGTTNSSPNNFTTVGSNVYFSATIAASTVKVFQTDGTSGGTVQVADTKPGGSDAPSSFAAVGSALYFKAQTTNNATANQRLPFILSSVTVSAPTISSPTSASITVNGASLGGNVTSDGGGALTEVGVVYAPTTTNANPQLNGTGVTKVTGTAATGVFTVAVSGLTNAKQYLFAAYATNGAGTTYSSVATFTTVTPPQRALTAPIYVFVRPGGTSYTFTIPTDNVPSALQDVGFQNISAFSWILSRAGLQSSTDGGVTWTPYAIQTNNIAAYLPVTGRIFRMVDTLPADTTNFNNFGNSWHTVANPGSTSSSGGTLSPDTAPTDLTADRTTVFFGQAQGTKLAGVTPVDTGATTGGNWVLESQSVSNLFAISFDNTKDNTVSLNMGTGTMPAIGTVVTATLRYYDVYQTDGSGNPITGQGFSKQLSFTVTSEVSNDLTLGNDVAVNTFTTNNQSAASVAGLSTGNLSVVWQSAGQGGKSTTAFNGIYGQLLSSTGSKVGSEFVVSNAGATVDEITPSVAALNSGRFVVAYSTKSGANYDIGFRIIEANGTVGAQIIANAAAAVDKFNPSVVTLTDGSFVIAWSDGNGDVRARQFAAAAGAALSAEVLFADHTVAGGYYPAVGALSSGSYVVGWAGISNSHVFVKVAGGSAVDTAIVSSGSAPPRIAGLTGGGFVIASESYNSGTSQNQIEAVRYNNAGTIQGTKFQVNTVTTGNRYAAAVAALTGGGFVVGWMADNGDYELNGLFGRRYTSAGAAVDASEFEINQHRAGDQSYAFLTAMPNDTFAAAWTTTAASIAAGTYLGDITARILAPTVVAPTVTSISPTSGSTLGGDTVTITGTNFTGATAVKFGATNSASFTVDSATQITATAPAGSAGTVDVRVTTPGGTSATSAADQFTYLAPPTVTLLTPQRGPSAGGTSVTITGTNFIGVTDVNIGSAAVTGFTVVNSTTITCTTPAGTAGTASVLVTSPGGQNAANSLYTYVDPPTITNSTPIVAPVAGGPQVTLTGTNFTFVQSVTIGGSTVPSISIPNNHTITFNAPAGTAGTYDVVVTTSGGSATSVGLFTYAGVPTVTAISPAAGPVDGGAPVTITGTNFIAPASVKIGGSSATSVVVVNSTTITCLTPSGGPGSPQSVVVTTPGGSNGANTLYSYQNPPYINFTGPKSGPTAGGTSVTIDGGNFTGTTSVTFNGVAATLGTVGDSSITCTTPAGTAGTISIVVTAPGGKTTPDGISTFTYVAPPIVTGISPTSGPATGGTSVTITGTNLTGATAVKFGATNAASFIVNSATSITATTAAGTGTVDVTVTTVGGTSATSAADQFTFVPAPTVTGISPTAGPTTGGTSVTVTGTNFTGATAVKFGATNAASFTVNSATQITATSPAGTGTVDVTVTTVGGTSATSAADQFTFVPAPTITSISPSAGPATGATSVTVTGTNFTGATAVKFGATNAASFTVNSATSITATSPAGTGTVDIRVTTVGGTSGTSAADQFTYIPAPTVTSLSPTAGPTAGGTSVTVTGTNFTGATAVTFGATAATSFTVNSATSITATSPAGTGTVDLKVTTVGGTSATSAADQYTFVALPTVTSISPTAGPTAGGTTVVITGTNLTAATAVTFGATAATGFTVNSATQITATSPAGTGTVDVRVTTAGGTSATSAADQFTYVPAPTVASLSPAAGPATGGTTVVITGTNFTGATAVTFGATAATGFTVNSATQITATSPAATGTVDVRVTTVGGTSATSAADQFTFVPAPAITSISPTAGPTAGGTSVTITGTNFTGATAVTFGATAATGFTVNSATSITATSPAGTGTVDVRVTTVGGTSATSAGDQFTYVARPVVASISPVSGPTVGGTSVTITGSNFSGATAVTFGATAATGFTVNSATQITATSPAGSTGAVDITVTTVGGTSATSAADLFTFTTANHFTVTAPGTAAAGTAFNVTVTALDSFNNLASGYTGTVHFTSTDGNAVLHADTTLTNGAGTFSVTLENAGSQTVTATDTVSSGINGTTGGITVGESITLAATDASAAVGVVDTGTYRFTRGGNGAAVTVNFSLDGASTASAGEFSLTGGSVSFNGSTGTVIIPAGNTSVDVTLTASSAGSGGIAKPSKTVQLNVATGSTYTAGSPSTGTVTIAQNGFVVFNASDSGQGSLRQAIANANALAGDDTITFDSMLFGGPQTITLSSGSLNVSGNGKTVIAAPAAGLTISGGSSGRVFTTSGTADLTLIDLTIVNGSTAGNGGGILHGAGTLTLISSTVAGNFSSVGLGGGIYAASGTTTRIINSTISNNSAGGGGTAGGIDSAGTLTVINSTIYGNTVYSNNAGNAGGLRQAGTATLTNVTIAGNAVSGAGTLGASGMQVVSGTVTVGNKLIASNTNDNTTPDIVGAFTSAGSNLIGNKGTATGLTNGVNGDQAGTGASVLNPQIGSLANNGGPTPTVLLLSGSPAINAGNSALLPADTFDLDGDSNVAETLPVDQRGAGFPRIQGSTVDIGAVEGLVFTPALTATTTNEDVQSSSGLVISANAADAGGTTSYQITAITGGTLFKSDGSTAIANNAFITKAEGAAGLKFTPSADLFSPTTTFGFSVQASISADVSGLKDAVVPASVTVNPVADTPSVTNTSTTVNVQSVSGLVITRNAVDGAEVGYFKISNIQHGTLYQNNGTTVINAGDYITVAQGGAGLKFTSALNYTGLASFDVQGSVDNAGTGLGGGIATASIAIGTVNPTPVQLVPTDPVTGLPLPPGSPYPVVSQSGTYEVRMSITNTTAFPINGFRLSVDYSAYLAAQPSLRLYNSSSAPGVVPAYIDYPFPVAVGATVSLKLQFYTSTRKMPNPFSPTLAVTTLAASEVSSTDGSGVQPRLNVRPNGTILLEWDSIPGHWYRVKYSADLVNWFDSPVPTQASANRTQWLDDGAPLTNVSPATVPARFYRVNEIAAPTP